MKSYVITILDNPKSVEAANRCIKSAESQAGIEVKKWKAITPANMPERIALKENIPNTNFINKFSRYHNCLSAFLSHYFLWKECVKIQEPILILEHDAVFVNDIPEFIDFKGCLSLGHPSYGKFNTPMTLGVGPLVSKQYLPGAHAYIIKPWAAEDFISRAQKHAGPTDVFINIHYFGYLEEYYPWPVKALDTFSTIQQQTGCIAKHGYHDSYEIVQV